LKEFYKHNQICFIVFSMMFDPKFSSTKSLSECRRRLCQLGERCSDGLCIRVSGQSCKLAERNCGEHFDCLDGRCVDRIRPIDPAFLFLEDADPSSSSSTLVDFGAALLNATSTTNETAAQS
jgi:hypothetical protein